MSTRTVKRNNDRRGSRANRDGIILLVVLGMLTLFSILAVSYLVFTSRQRATAFNTNRAEISARNPQPWFNEAAKQIMVGPNGPESSMWGHDLFGDLYGMRDGIEGQLTPASNFVVADNLVAPEVLLEAFVRVPTNLYFNAVYTNQRFARPGQMDAREYPQAPGLFTLTEFPTDDSVTGRIVTFTDGPLEDLSMKVVRYFGDHTGATNGRAILSGQLVLDMRPHLQRSITIDSLNETRTLSEWIERHRDTSIGFDISQLFYDRDATVGSGATPLASFYMNGRILNGPGLGWDVERDNNLSPTGSEFNLNETIGVQYNPVSPVAATVKTGVAFEGSNSGADIPVALQGHYALYRNEPDNAAGSDALSYLQDLPGGDTDEPYDAPDEQNWWLSYIPDNPGTVDVLGSPAPSYVRPGLIHWLVNQQGTVPLQNLSVNRLREILRAIQRATLRPIPIRNDPAMPASVAARGPGVLQLDYSNFTAGHPSNTGFGAGVDFAETDPAVLANQIRNLALQLVGRDVDGDGLPDWDVDSNGDGIPDSVWIDIGLPLSRSDDGKLAKPMVAILIEDLGGRVNVNLSGNLAQARNRILRTAQGALARANTIPNAATSSTSELPAGFGYGPAEIDIRALFTHPSVAFGNGSLNLLRRRLTSRTVGGVEYVAAGHLIDPLTQNGNDLIGVLREPFHPNLHRPSNNFGLPMDKFGRGSLALGVNGGLMISGVSAPLDNAGASAGDVADDPYEFDWLPGGQPDNAFSSSDLEGMLRFNDFDLEALNSQLAALAADHFRSASPDQTVVNAARQEFAHAITTQSNSVAISTGILPSEFRNSSDISQQPNTPQRLITDGLEPAGTLTEAARNALLMELLPQEMMAGHKLNLNRPFGNGIDDDGDGVVDDPQELRNAVEVFYRDFTGTPSNTSYTTSYSDVTVGAPGPVQPAPNPFLEPTPQSLFARHLYVLAMSLVRDKSGSGDEYDFTLGNAGSITIDPTNQTYRSNPTGGAIVNGAELEFRAWRLAQWAINVADFRDPDSIMSRFDYDVYPYDGWDVTPPPPFVPQPTSRVVWGMEYPELALEESLAFHDRRVRDTNLEAAVAPEQPDPRFSGGQFRDDDLDQWRIPQGSLFFELRSTRSPDFLRVPANDGDATAQSWAVPSELYGQIDIDPSASVITEYALDLARRAPDRNPVWRVAITRAHPATGGAGTRELSGDEMLQPVGSIENSTFTGPPNRLTSTLQPDRPDFFGPQILDSIDRVVWFTNENPDDGVLTDGTAGDGIVDFAPLDSRNIERIFYNRFPAGDYPYQDTTDTDVEVYLRGGQYAVIGPRSVTHVGSLKTNGVTGMMTHDPATYAPLVSYAEYESPQRFLLGSTSFEHRLISNSRATPLVDNGTGTALASMRPTVGIVAGANPPPGFVGPPITPGGQIGIGLNVSEPLPYPAPAGVDSYYPTPTHQLRGDFPFDSYYDFDNADGAFPDDPFDARPYSELFKAFGPQAERTGTRERFKTAYLQRLADPTSPFDALLNPYITVDYITVDLTVFNGSEENREETESGPPPVTEWIDRLDPDPFNSGPPEAFASRYKTGRVLDERYDAAGITSNLSHSYNTVPPQERTTLAVAPAPPGSTPIGPQTADHEPFFPFTLNIQDIVNPDLNGANAINLSAQRDTHSSTLGYANASYGPRWSQPAGGDISMSSYIGTPYQEWFSSVTWLNRPYASPGEMMWVPTTSAGRFGAQFGTTTANTGFQAGDFYLGDNTQVGTRQLFERNFPHLWNYFSGNGNDLAMSPNLWRIMDWVTVPPPYDAEVDFLSTNNDVRQFATANTVAASSFGERVDYLLLGGPTTTGDPDTWVNVPPNAFWLNRFPVEAFRTPNNILNPQFRQGRINLNTIKNARVYRALMNGISLSTDPVEGAFFSEFVQSRRGYELPPTSLPAEDMNVNVLLPAFNAEHASQFAGAFRPSAASDIAPLTGDRSDHPLGKSLMRPGGTIDTPTETPLFSRPLANSNVLENWSGRSVAHQQLPLTRLPNLVTDQSNVFAVWVTVGLFEVDSASSSVGEEVGSDLGQVRRYREFHIIDRSVPVMYEPGQLNNAEEAIILSRRLQ
ncbi:MAG: hypothetical protein AAGG48_18725 [Planctomycetota bacterium]